MNPLRTVSVILVLFLSLGRAVAADPASQGASLTPAQMEELVSPIALYPDPLVALLLPASTFPSDIVLAARFLSHGGLPDRASAEPWDDSVKALAHYREVIDYLDANLEWTRRLGQCFLDQPDGVMDAVQTLRIRARAAGLLKDSPEQQVIVEPEQILIVPAQPTVIYVPHYDPAIFYQPVIPAYYGYGTPFITFGIGWGIGSWLNYDCNWYSRSVHVVHRPAHWYHRPVWHGHQRHSTYNVTQWTRRAPYPGQDHRFDRSPRHTSTGVRVSDHRTTAYSNPYAGRTTQNNNRPSTRNVSPTVQTQQRSDYSNNRRRTETDRAPRSNISQATAPVIPPVATTQTPVTRPSRTNRRPEMGTQSATERRPDSPNNNPSRPNRRPEMGTQSATERRTDSPSNNPSRANRSQPTVRTISQPPVRTAPSSSTSTPAPATARNARPATQAPAPARRVETQERTEERHGETQNQRATNRPSAGRGGNREALQR